MRNPGPTKRRVYEIMRKRDLYKMGVVPYVMSNRIRLNITEARCINGYYQIELNRAEAKRLIKRLQQLIDWKY